VYAMEGSRLERWVSSRSNVMSKANSLGEFS
jgi:hypothetical protein